MTYDEAVNQLKTMISVYNEGKCTTAMRIAIKALEKQIPKKPELWHNQPYPPEWADDDWGYRCPACGNEEIDYPEHHCICGQTIDWSDCDG